MGSSEKVKQEKKVKVKSVNPLKGFHTDANRKRRQNNDSAFQIRKAGETHMRGDARRKRREAWMGVAKKVDKAIVKDVYNEEQKRMVPTTIKRTMWEPSFAEFTARQQRR